MADDETKNSDPPESGPDSGDEEEVHTAVETVDAKRKASSEPPPNEDETDETEDHETEDDDESEDDDEDDESKDSQTDDEEAEGGATAPKAAAEPKAHPTGAELEARGHHDFAHVTPVPLLLGVLGCLLVLTFATTAVTSIDMGGQWNLVVAMVIATAKASLVVTFFTLRGTRSSTWWCSSPRCCS